MKLKTIFNGALNYLAAVALSLVFALYLSGRIGWFLVAAFLCAPVVSLLLTLLFINRIYADASVNAAAICKGESCELTVSVSNDFFLPSPPVIVDMFSCPRAACSDKSTAVSLMPYSAESFDIKYTALICGPCSIGCSSVRLTDYFGLFSFKLKNINVSELTATLDIIPDIMDIKADNPVVTETAEMVALADDSEDTTENKNVRFGGFPGYESREYVPGDPLKRISWKQSAKKGKLLVRLDDEASSPTVTVILDRCMFKDRVNRGELFASKELSFCTDDNIIESAQQFSLEGALGLIRILFFNGYSVSFLLWGKNGWQLYPANDENDLSVIQTELASYSFSENGEIERFPAEELQGMKGKVSVFCTPYGDGLLLNELAPYASKSGKEEIKTVLFCPASEKGGEISG